MAEDDADADAGDGGDGSSDGDGPTPREFAPGEKESAVREEPGGVDDLEPQVEPEVEPEFKEAEVVDRDEEGSDPLSDVPDGATTGGGHASGAERSDAEPAAADEPATATGTVSDEPATADDHAVGETTDEKNPVLAALLSLVIPGAGQVYNGQVARGAVAFGGALVLDLVIVVAAIILTLILIGPLLLLLIPVVHAVVMYDAYNQATLINEGEVVPDGL